MKPIYLSFLILFSSLLFPYNTFAANYDDMPGSSVDKCFGAAQPSQLKFKNTSKQDFYDFAFSLRYKDGSPVDFQIDSVHVKVRGKDRKFVPMAGGNGVYRIGAKDANGKYTDVENVDANDIFTLDIFLDQAPSKPWCVNIQPTDKNSRCIAASDVNADFGNQRSYVLNLDSDMAGSNLFPGVSFADRNMSGYPIDTFVLQSPTNQILNPVFLDAQGDTVPPLFFDPLTGILLPPLPLPPGAPFHIGFGVDTFLMNMQFDLMAPLPGPLAEPFIQLPFVQQLFHDSLPTTTLIFPYEYHVPPYYPEPFLQIFVEIPGSTQPPVWIGQNILLEHFWDTMQVDLFATLGGAFLSGPMTGVSLGWTLTDTLAMVYPAPSPFIFGNVPLIPEHSGYGAVPIGPITLPPVPLPPLPPRQWENDISRGVLIGCHMPNMDLDSSRYRGDGLPKPYVPDDYAGDWNACGPVATTNSFSWLRKIYPDIDQKLGNAFGQGDTAMRKMLAEFSEMMDRFSEDQVYITDFVEAKLAFVDKYKLPIRVSWQSMHRTERSIASPNPAYGHKADRNTPAAEPGQTMAGITPEFLMEALQDSCDTEILFNWRKVDSAGNVTYPNGHYVTLTGIRNSGGNWRIKWKDDRNQHGAGGTRQGTSPMEVDSATGMVRIPGLDNEAWGQCFISNVAIECYDPTVTFRGVRGRAFRDPSGSGTSSGTTGAGGLTVGIVDASSGDVVQTTTTEPDGSYVLDQIGDPTTPKFIFFDVPLGSSISPQNVGTNDSLDSDIDPLTGLSPVFTFSSDTFYVFDGGFALPSYEIRVLPEGHYDPQCGCLDQVLEQYGLLPHKDTLPLWGFPIEPAWPDSILPLNDRIPPFVDSTFLDPHYLMPPVDWAFVAFWDSLNAAQPVLAISTLLLPDGQLVTPGFDPIDLFRLPLPPTADSLYVSVWIPGHLGHITAQPVPLDQPLLALHFDDPLLPLPPGMDRLTLSTQSVLMPMGDTNADGVVDAADRSQTWNGRDNAGYRLDDVTRDGVVDAADRAATWNNRDLQGHRPK